MGLPVINLKMIITVHWLLTTWGCLTSWLPQPYIWSNYAVLAIGVWAIAQRDSVDALAMYLIGMIITILLDMIHIAVNYERVAGSQFGGAARDQFRFSVGMTILSLLLKPVSCLFVYQMYMERGGHCNLNIGFPDLTGSRDRTSYQTIGEQEPHCPPSPSSETKITVPGY
ncbi:type-1 angiotensin II receptor-associated protein isoform X2 [Rhinoraja longicauda]